MINEWNLLQIEAQLNIYASIIMNVFFIASGAATGHLEIFMCS